MTTAKVIADASATSPTGTIGTGFRALLAKVDRQGRINTVKRVRQIWLEKGLQRGDVCPRRKSTTPWWTMTQVKYRDLFILATRPYGLAILWRPVRAENRIDDTAVAGWGRHLNRGALPHSLSLQQVMS